MTEEEIDSRIAELRKQQPTRAEFIAECQRAGLIVTTFSGFRDNAGRMGVAEMPQSDTKSR